ncbi:MAG: DUF11 domain-containing protein, partial [Defluviitaleaceae bacterium]|nr:DUF11 domain-containing protein [Defluviitaleaceae bacterium]
MKNLSWKRKLALILVFVLFTSTLGYFTFAWNQDGEDAGYGASVTTPSAINVAPPVVITTPGAIELEPVAPMVYIPIAPTAATHDNWDLSRFVTDVTMVSVATGQPVLPGGSFSAGGFYRFNIRFAPGFGENFAYYDGLNPAWVDHLVYRLPSALIITEDILNTPVMVGSGANQQRIGWVHIHENGDVLVTLDDLDAGNPLSALAFILEITARFVPGDGGGGIGDQMLLDFGTGSTITITVTDPVDAPLALTINNTWDRHRQVVDYLVTIEPGATLAAPIDDIVAHIFPWLANQGVGNVNMDNGAMVPPISAFSGFRYRIVDATGGVVSPWTNINVTWHNNNTGAVANAPNRRYFSVDFTGRTLIEGLRIELEYSVCVQAVIADNRINPITAAIDINTNSVNFTEAMHNMRHPERYNFVLGAYGVATSRAPNTVDSDVISIRRDYYLTFNRFGLSRADGVINAGIYLRTPNLTREGRGLGGAHTAETWYYSQLPNDFQLPNLGGFPLVITLGMDQNGNIANIPAGNPNVGLAFPSFNEITVELRSAIPGQSFVTTTHLLSDPMFTAVLSNTPGQTNNVLTITFPELVDGRGIYRAYIRFAAPITIPNLNQGVWSPRNFHMGAEYGASTVARRETRVLHINHPGNFWNKVSHRSPDDIITAGEDIRWTAWAGNTAMRLNGVNFTDTLDERLSFPNPSDIIVRFYNNPQSDYNPTHGTFFGIDSRVRHSAGTGGYDFTAQMLIDMGLFVFEPSTHPNYIGSDTFVITVPAADRAIPGAGGAVFGDIYRVWFEYTTPTPLPGDPGFRPDAYFNRLSMDRALITGPNPHITRFVQMGLADISYRLTSSGVRTNAAGDGYEIAYTFTMHVPGIYHGRRIYSTHFTRVNSGMVNMGNLPNEVAFRAFTHRHFNPLYAGYVGNLNVRLYDHQGNYYRTLNAGTDFMVIPYSPRNPSGSMLVAHGFVIVPGLTAANAPSPAWPSPRTDVEGGTWWASSAITPNFYWQFDTNKTMVITYSYPLHDTVPSSGITFDFLTRMQARLHSNNANRLFYHSAMLAYERAPGALTKDRSNDIDHSHRQLYDAWPVVTETPPMQGNSSAFRLITSINTFGGSSLDRLTTKPLFTEGNAIMTIEIDERLELVPNSIVVWTSIGTLNARFFGPYHLDGTQFDNLVSGNVITLDFTTMNQITDQSLRHNLGTNAMRNQFDTWLGFTNKTVAVPPNPLWYLDSTFNGLIGTSSIADPFMVQYQLRVRADALYQIEGEVELPVITRVFSTAEGIGAPAIDPLFNYRLNNVVSIDSGTVTVGTADNAVDFNHRVVSRNNAVFSTTTTFTFEHNVLDKTMVLNEPGSNLVHTTILINEAGAPLLPANAYSPYITAIDRMSINLMPFASTIQFETRAREGTGWGPWTVVSPQAAPGSGEPWSFNIVGAVMVNGTPFFEIEFVFPDEVPVRITYDSIINAPPNGAPLTLSNTVRLYGTQFEDGYYVPGHVITEVAARAAILHMPIYLNKRDDNTHAGLAGAVMAMYIHNPSTNGHHGVGPMPAPADVRVINGMRFYPAQTVTTPAGGVARFDHPAIVPYWGNLYLFVEMEAPDGYVLPTGNDAFTFFAFAESLLPPVNMNVTALQNSLRNAIPNATIELVADIVVVDNEMLPPNPRVRIEKEVSAPVAVGGTLTYTLRVTNTGNVPLTGLVVTDTLPAYLTNPRQLFVLDLPGSTGGISGQVVSVTLATLNPNQTATITFQATVATAPADGASIYNSAVVEYPPNTTIRDEDSVPVPVQTRGVSIIKTVSDNHVEAGAYLTYTLRIQNTGQVQLNGLVVTDSLPIHLTNPRFLQIPATASGGFTGNNLRVTLGILAPGDHVYITFVVTASSSPLGGAPVINTAHVEYPGDPDNVRDSDYAEVTIDTNPNMTLSKTVSAPADGASVAVGGTVTYRLQITNTGNIPLNGVVITDILPVYLSNPTNFRSPTISNVQHTINGQTVNITVDVPLQTAIIVEFDVTVASAPANNADIINIARAVYPNNPDLDREDTARVPVIRRGVSIDKTSSPATVAVDGTITYTLAIRNTGNVALNGLTVTDILPVYLTNPRNFGLPSQVTDHNVTGQTVMFTLDLPVSDAPVTITFDVTVASAPANNEIANTAVAQYPGDTTVRDESSSTTTLIPQGTTPAETTPAETTPTETTPVETTPAETTPVETTPAETTPTETTPAETTPVETTPAETTPT